MHFSAPVPQPWVIRLRWHHHTANHAPVLASLRELSRGLHTGGFRVEVLGALKRNANAHDLKQQCILKGHICVCVPVMAFYMLQRGSNYNHKGHEM